MNKSRELCRNFQRGSCQYGNRCKFVHASQQQSRPNPFGFGTQNTSQFFNTSQQQKPNPFGFGVQNGSASKVTANSGGRFESNTKPFENKWTRSSAATTTNSTQAQPQAATHQCTDPESCKRLIVDDFKTELPLWRLTCYGHWRNFPCDIVGDISYEELRAAAYEDARKGLPLQAIIERERNLYNSKSAEFDNLLRNPYKPPSSRSAETNLFSGANITPPSMVLQNHAPTQSNTPPLFSSFSQLGTSANVGFSVRPQAPATPQSPFFGQSNFPQYNSHQQAPATQPSPFVGGTEMKISTSGIFGGQLASQAFGTSPSPNTTSFQTGTAAIGNNQFSSPFFPTQSPSPANNQWPISLDVPSVTSDTVHQASTNQEDAPDDSVWLKKEWAVGEIPIVAPPERFCM